jgi:ribosomal-protein-alanine N-acetyltransferase
MRIRRAEPRDVGEIKRIEIDAGLSPWSEQDYALEATRSDSIFLVVEEQGAIVGFLLARLITIEQSSPDLECRRSTAEIYNLAIASDFRRRQAASNLLTALLRDLPRQQTPTVTLEVRTRNHSAIAFYQARGFTIIGTRRNFYSNPADDAFVMRLNRSIGGTRGT